MDNRDAKKEVELLFEFVRDLYGDRLTDEELEEVRNGVEHIAETAAALRSIKLENSVEPFSVFKPHRKEA
ncbi:MAG: hypothetical protein JSV18_01620 [Candidatus Bathyarchaeota archaeon]|nr:MAG: hypothetical protein JSV18_01620 [Candidatus Bathyarchaeota archaeon]